MSLVRCFFALTISAANRDLISAARDSLLRTDSSWAGEKWVRPENLHITLLFCPDLPIPRVLPLMEEVAEASRGIAPFELSIGTVLALPRLQSARMVWVSLRDPDGHSARLAAAIRGACAEDPGSAAGQRTFRAHITFARARRPRPLTQDALAAAQRTIEDSDLHRRSVSVSSVTLFESRLGTKGPTYTELASAPLGID